MYNDLEVSLNRKLSKSNFETEKAGLEPSYDPFSLFVFDHE